MQEYKNYIIGLLALIIIGSLFYFTNNSANQTSQESNQNNSQTQAQADNYSTTTDKQTQTNTNTNMNTQKETYTVKMETNKGNIVLVLNSKIAPNTVANFVKLSSSGFYDGVKFHRVIKDFMIQAGDPQSKDEKLVDMWGTGGPGYKFADEIFDPATYKTGYKRGVLAMANSGPNTNGSQFFIMHKDVPLPPNYTIFGKIKVDDTESFKTLDAIASVKTIDPASHNDRPVDAVVINKVTVE